MAKQDNTDGPYSLAIEQNSLSLEQVSALFDGKRMVEPTRDIQEVRNAFAAYEALSRWNPTDRTHLLEAHGLLMGVGIYRGDQLVHMAPPAARATWLPSCPVSWRPSTMRCVRRSVRRCVRRSMR